MRSLAVLLVALLVVCLALGTDPIELVGGVVRWLTIK